MQLRELTTKEEMLKNYIILLEVYPTLTKEEYSNELDVMLPHNYGQVGIFDKNNQCIALTGYWIGSKLWCGKYLELDNVVVSKKHRSKGLGDQLFQHMKTMAIDKGCTMLALDSYSTNFKAHKFFYGQDYAPRGFHFINVLDKTKVR